MGPCDLRGRNCSAGRRCLGPSSCAGAFIQPYAAAAALPPVRVGGWLRRLGLGWVPGLRLAWARLSCLSVQPVSLMSTRSAFVSRGRVYPAGCSCGGCAAGARWGLAAPLGLGVGAWLSSRVGAFILPGAAAAAVPPVRVWVAVPLWVRQGAWRVDVLRICRTLMPPFPPYKLSLPLRGGCRRQPAGGGAVHAPSPPASLYPAGWGTVYTPIHAASQTL